MITIRPAIAGDVADLFRMLRDSATAQGFPASLAVTEADLLQDGFGASPRFQCLIAESDGEAAGLALYFVIYSTWVTRSVLYLEDLYVDQAFRRLGIARALLEELKRNATEMHCGQMRWVVHRENQPAIDLYREFDAHPLHDWLLMSQTL